MGKIRVVMMGAAGRDFHNFNVYFRDNEAYDVVAFTATQIPDIEGRIYPPELAGRLYSQGIPIEAEENLVDLIKEKDIDQVIFAYSDVSHEYIGHRAAVVNGAGADFILMGSKRTMLKSKVPVISVCAVRTGCGKSQTTRKISQILRDKRKRVVAIRHPMPYGDLAKQKVQRFAKYVDLEAHNCTIEEMEEYEPHLDIGNIVYAGVDYGAILEQAEKEADVILWDGGNNDTSFYEPDLLIVVVDPHRSGHELKYYPGETNLRTADVIIVNKVDTADLDCIEHIRSNIRRVNPGAVVIDAASPLYVEDPDIIRGKRVLVVEDGPTLTHGEMKYGAGVMAAKKYGALEIVDPRPWVKGTIAETFEKYPNIGPLLPAMGYGDQQIKDLYETIEAVECDAVVVGTPIDLAKVVKIRKPFVRVQYKLQEIGEPTLEDVLKEF
jgi:predicted GTPase